MRGNLHLGQLPRRDYRGRRLGAQTAQTAVKRRFQIGMRKAGDRHNPRMIPALLGAVLVLAVLIFLFSGRARPVRAVSPEDSPKASLQLCFTGDAMMGRYIQDYADAKGYDAILADVKDVWADADYVFTNLEYTVLVRDPSVYTPEYKYYNLSAPPASVEALVDGGINVFSVANNHAGDYKAQGFLDEVAWMHQRGLNFSGYYLSPTNLERYEQDASLLDLYSAYTEQKYTVLPCENGMTVGFLAVVSPHTSEISLTEYLLKSTNAELYEYVFECAMATDLTVVYLHSGMEYTIVPTENQRELARSLIDAGADIVISAHPHVLQTAELYGDGIIFYSLGNFISDQYGTTQRDSVIVQYNLEEDGTGSFTLLPVRINNGFPQLTSGRYYRNRINRALTKDLDKDAYCFNGDGNVVIPWTKAQTDTGYTP